MNTFLEVKEIIRLSTIAFGVCWVMLMRSRRWEKVVVVCELSVKSVIRRIRRIRGSDKEGVGVSWDGISERSDSRRPQIRQIDGEIET